MDIRDEWDGVALIMRVAAAIRLRIRQSDNESRRQNPAASLTSDRAAITIVALFARRDVILHCIALRRRAAIQRYQPPGHWQGAAGQMDELDLQIIVVLQADGRASNAKIARAVGVSEGTVRRRLHRLFEEDIVHIIAVPNLEKMGFGTTALIGLETGPGKSDIVAESIADLDEAHYVVVATGPYDVFVWTALESAESLGDFLRTRIGVIEGVQKTQTFVTLSTKKRFQRM